MTESEFLALAEATLDRIEEAAEEAAEAADVDVECSRRGNVLEIEVGAGKVIVNSQAPMQEIWLAARAGGFHYRHDGQRWQDTRGGRELFAALTDILSEQGGAEMKLTAE